MVYPAMRLSYLLLLLGLPLLTEAAQVSKLRVLFIGNSYTYYNDLPVMFRNLAKAAQPDLNLEVRAITEGGISLGEMWHKREVQDVLDKEHWDYVVLQEQSTLGWAYREGEEVVNDPSYFWTNLNLFVPKIRRAGAVPVLYLTWSRRSKPDAQPELDHAYWVGAREHKARVAPVGRAWAAVRQANPDIELFTNDGSHPTLAGSFLAACVFVNTLVESKSTGLPVPPGLPPETAAILQNAADASIEDWRKVSPPANGRRRPANGDPAAPPDLANSSFQGVWRGKTWLYRQAATIEADVKMDGDQCQVTWSVAAEGNSTRSVRTASSCKVENASLIFVVQDWFSSAVETHTVRLQGKELVGRVSVGFRTASRQASGTWRARPSR